MEVGDSIFGTIASGSRERREVEEPKVWTLFIEVLEVATVIRAIGPHGLPFREEPSSRFDRVKRASTVNSPSERQIASCHILNPFASPIGSRPMVSGLVLAHTICQCTMAESSRDAAATAWILARVAFWSIFNHYAT